MTDDSVTVHTHIEAMTLMTRYLFFPSLCILWVLLLSWFLPSDILAQSTTSVHFQVDMNIIDPENRIGVGIRGDHLPLSWETTYPLIDDDGDGVYNASIPFENFSPPRILNFKFVYGDTTWELPNQDNRAIFVHSDSLSLPLLTWDSPNSAAVTQLKEFSISASDLQQDAAILKRALFELHPGLFRYSSSEQVKAHITTFEQTLNRPMSFREAYLAFSEFVPELLCGHTLVNPFNQESVIKQLLFDGADKIPFTFDIVENRMIVTKSVTQHSELRQGTEILSINGVSIPDILERLIQFVSADGSNDGKRLYELQLTGIGQHELFDVYFPALYPPGKDGYRVTGRNDGASIFDIAVPPISRAQRKEELNQKYGPLPDSYDELWSFEIIDDQTAYLKVGTFVTYKMSMDWKAFLKEAFNTLEENEIPNLVIDIRGNAGGMDEVGKSILEHISRTPVTLPATEYRLAYNKVPDELRPYLSTWDNSIFDLSKRVRNTGNGYFVETNATTGPTVYQPEKNPYQGQVYLLVDAANSSATFFLAKTVKQNKLGTLVGEITGGNLMGTNGGMMFFLRLPNSLVEVDIPLYGYYPMDKQPDRGVIPDVQVDRTVEGIREGTDTILDATLNLIEAAQRK